MVKRQVDRDRAGLEAVAAMAGRQVPLSLGHHVGVNVAAQLLMEGRIRVAVGDFVDPTAALEALGIDGLNGWEAWHLGDGYGPSLAESIDEINRFSSDYRIS